MHEELRYRLLGWWAGLVSRRPRWVLFVATAAVLASVSVTVHHLKFQSDRNRLIADDIPWNERFNDWRDSFVGRDDLTIVVDSYRNGRPSPKHRIRAEQLVDELAEALRRDRAHVHAVVCGFDTSRVGPRALRTSNWDQFESRVRQIEQAEPLLASGRPLALFEHIESRFKLQAIALAGSAQPQSIQQLTQVIDAFHEVIQKLPKDRAGLSSIVARSFAQGPGWRYLESQPDGRLLFIRITPAQTTSTINALSQSIEAIRGIMKQTGAAHPDVAFGLTGLEVVEADETDAVARDSILASVVAFVLIAVLLISAFHSWRTPLLALLSLIYGIAWTFGYLTLVIGHLQVISVVVCVILLGLGIAYGIHLASRFELIRHNYPDGPDGFEAALRDSLATMGPGIITGALTTAAAFVTTAFTEYKGVGEMGIIAAGGIMLCLLAMFSVFPALLRLVKPKHKHFRPMAARRFHFFEERWVKPFVRWPRITVAVALALTLVSLLAITQMKFDYNLMRLQPSGIESVEWQQRVARFGGRSIFAAVCIVTNLEKGMALTKALREKETVKDVGGAALLFPEDDDAKCDRLEQAHHRLRPLLERIRPPDESQPSQAATTPDQMLDCLDSLRDTVQKRKPFVMLLPSLWPHYQDLALAVDRLTAAVRKLSPQLRPIRLATLDLEYDVWRRQTATEIEAALDTRAMKFEDLPADLMRPYRDQKGRLALEVYPDNERLGFASPLDPQFMPLFINEVRTSISSVHTPKTNNQEQGWPRTAAASTVPTDPRPILTGPMMQFYQSGQLILVSYRVAGLSALLVVLVLVWIDFHRLEDAGLAMIPVGIGFAVTFGVMWALGMSINPANIIVLPLMFGIGVDSGVHVLHRYRQDGQTRPLGLTDGTGKGITITSLTTMIGFGALMLARHRGIFSLGLVMTLGIGLTMVACLTVMPAWLEWRQQNLQKRHPEDEPEFPKPRLTRASDDDDLRTTRIGA